MGKRLSALWPRLRAAGGYVMVHHKQLIGAASLGAAALEAIKKAH